MTRKLTSILLTSAGVLFGVGACGGDDKPLPPVKAISACDTNKVATGGYIWTYTDAGNNTYGTVDPFTVWDEATQTGQSFTVTAAPEATDSGNNSCRIAGTKPEDPTSTNEQSAHFTELDSCGDAPRYPVAGIGFSFLDKNDRFSVCEKLGIRFRARGTIVGTDGVPAATLPVRVAIPTVETDLWVEGDKWVGSKAEQVCYCQNNLPADLDTKTCFGFYGKLIDVTAEWQWFTMLWGEMTQPSWSGPAVFDPNNVLKAQFGIEGKGDYALEIDDIQFVMPADGVNWCANSVPYTNIAATNADFCALAAPGDPSCDPTKLPEHF